MFYELNVTDYESSISNSLENQSIDTAFRKVTHTSIGFYKWRVDNQRIEVVPKDQYEIFNDNSVYIIYVAAPKGSFVNKDTINREVKTNIQLEKYIHFWLGNAATQQDSGNVSYKVMELDSHLGNVATQYRETQENESDRFLSYFKDGIIIRSINCNNSSNVSLFHVSGKCSPKCIQRTLEWDVFSSEYIMMLKTTAHIFLWIGRSTEESEKLNGLKFAKRFHGDEKNLELVVVNDGYEQSLNQHRKGDWCTYLPLSSRRVKHLGKLIESPSTSTMKLYQCGLVGGKYRIEERKSSGVNQSDFNDKNSAFIVDCAKKGVWIWLGRCCSTRDKSEAMRNARGFVRKKQYPSNVSVVRTVDGFEPNEFRNLFPFWYNAQGSGNKTKTVLGRIDTKILNERASLAAETQLIDDGAGDVMIYKVGKSNLIKVPQRDAQCLFSTETYVIHYTLMIPENNLQFERPSVRHILYLWIGKQCPSSTRDIGEKLSNELFQHLQKNVMQIRLYDGFESPHFLQIFSGKLIVFDGVAWSAEESKFPKLFVLKVTGNSTFTSRATQINHKTTFSSKDCMIVKCYDAVWLWCGQSSTGDAREAAKGIGGTLGDCVLAMESNEPEDFWISLPDQWKNKFRNLPNGDELGYHFNVDKERVRLFVCSVIQGSIKFDQIIAFGQTDLRPEDVFVLDIDCMLYVWIGAASNIRSGQFSSQQIAETYRSDSPLTRNKSMAVAIIQQGFEPSSFVGFFDHWNYKMWNLNQSFDDQIAHLTKTSTPSNVKPKQQDCDFDRYPKYPLDVLRSEIDQLPDSVDPKRKEIHLTNDDFVSIFEMDFSEFETLPNWKKQELKKKFKLF